MMSGEWWYVDSGYQNEGERLEEYALRTLRLHRTGTQIRKKKKVEDKKQKGTNRGRVEKTPFDHFLHQQQLPPTFQHHLPPVDSPSFPPFGRSSPPPHILHQPPHSYDVADDLSLLLL